MKLLIKLSVLSISLLVILAGSVVSPALSEITNAFPYAKTYLIKMVLTLPSIVLIPFSLLSGKISIKVRKRKLIIIGLIIYILGGIGGGISSSILILLFFRALLGVGLGLLVPLSTSLIADFFQGDERTKMMGYSNAVSNLGAIFATLVSGWLATLNWRLVFGTYLIALVALILVFFGLPEPPRRRTYNIDSYFFNKEILIIAFLALLLNIGFYSILTNISLFLTTNNIGNSESAGFAVSTLTFAGFIGGLFLKRITSKLKNYKIPFSIGLMSLGFLFLSIANSMPLVASSSFSIGLGLGILKPQIFLIVTQITPHFSNAFALSIVSSSIYLGKFLSPIILSFIGSVLNRNDISFTFFFVGICLLVATTISFIMVLYPSRLFTAKYNK
ncbi:MFS transporter [Sporosalibacterium faouarense]|uniref:MFS transporter n=1 Tax=Sporosalibacterium faouarense TaxID=516123 RepID=UPI00141C3B62|nr:MFS transporter [Sporosalibacterium faouarense]MTI47037.1 MFS transporter [Bacillota bacterium]